MKVSIADILKEEGYIADYVVSDAEVGKTLSITLKYVGDDSKPSIAGMKRVSRPGLRIYANSKELPRVLGGMGTAIISTSSGVMTQREASRRKLGGEVLAFVW
jgi:small subunit ribosomal protein S8